MKKKTEATTAKPFTFADSRRQAERRIALGTFGSSETDSAWVAMAAAKLEAATNAVSAPLPARTVPLHILQARARRLMEG